MPRRSLRPTIEVCSLVESVTPWVLRPGRAPASAPYATRRHYRGCTIPSVHGRTSRPRMEDGMATVDECRTALQQLAARLDANASAKQRLAIDRPLACGIKDLGVAFHARLKDGRLIDIADG